MHRFPPIRTLLFLALLPAFPATAQRIAIAADKMNVCYIGVDNPLTAAAFSCTGANLVLSTDNGEMISTGNGHFIYRPATPGIARITGYCTRGRDRVLIDAVQFRIKELPLPRATVARKSGGFISKAQLLAQTGIETMLEGYDFEARFTVTAYEFSIKRRTGAITPAVAVSSPYFTPEIKTAMQTLQAGDRILLDNIRCTGPDNRIRNCGTLVFIIE